MAADREMWEAFIVWCEREIADRREQLGPLESGTVHVGRKGPDTGFEWVDITTPRIHQLRNEIASLEAAIRRNKHNSDNPHA